MTPRPPSTFDVTGPLPRGLTVLEASAGTGKTFAVAALVTRYVAEGIPLEQLLVVTFTRMATGQLRARVRDRLVSAEAALQRRLEGAPLHPEDAVLGLLAAGDAEQVECRRRRLSTALADFDAATIATTHGFCEHVLAGLGVLGDVETDVTFVEDTGDLVDEVVDDLYVRRVLRDGHPGFSRAEAGEIAAAAMASPATPVAPERVPAGSSWDLRRRLALTVRAEVEQRKRRARVMTYDDLLFRLDRTLADPDRGPLACARLRDRYRVALVDEFQDTDPVQWDILRRAFGDGDSTLVLIGDPKQAIYNFRGADVYAYLDAAFSARTTATLGTNWRSDHDLIAATRALFADARLGHPDISFRAAGAAPGHRLGGLRGQGAEPPLRVRVVSRRDGTVELTPKGYVAKNPGEQHVAEDLAADVRRLVESGTELLTRDERGQQVSAAPIGPGDVAVLVRTNRQATRVRDALDDAGVPAVVSGAGSVFAARVAQDWLRLLEALERPASTSRIRTVALTSFVGWSAARLAASDDTELEALQAEVQGWSALLERRGVASLLETVSRNRSLARRLLAQSGGERQLTDLRHIGQLLHGESTDGRLGAAALASWLRRRIAEAGGDAATEERSRRLESDAEAVQVLTVHRSKGLEFPITYVPYLWTDQSVDQRPPVYHDPADGYRRKVDVGGHGGPDLKAHKHQRDWEERGEDLRLAYVALTRARHAVVCWWAASWGSRISPLGRLLFGRDGDGAVADQLKQPPEDADAVARLQELAEASGGRIAVEMSDGRPGEAPVKRPVADIELGVRRFDRELDARWRRTSYTAITANAHAGGEAEVGVGSEPGTRGVIDELMTGGFDTSPAPVPDPSPWASIPSSARTGTLVHAVLEGSDFAADDLAAELRGRADEEIQRQGTVDVAGGDLATALAAVLDTPLGPLAGGRSLGDVSTADRLDELNFELPLAGGDRPVGDVHLDAVGELLRRRLGHDDPLAGYGDRLGGPAFEQHLRGFLTGSIDLVMRLAPEPRFLVVDYKTNRLEGPSAYRPEALADAMQLAHYPLQALLYSVALHRYLRWRMAGYHPDKHIAGVLYLFVRGMHGAATPRTVDQPHGVFAWCPPRGLIAQLSDLLDGRS